MTKSFKALAKAWASLVDTVDALHDDKSWLELDGDTRTQLLIDLKEMTNAMGHAKDEARRAGVLEGGRNGDSPNDHVRTESEIRKELARAAAKAALSPAATRAARAARRKAVKRRKRRR